jgi:hypothetical protein
MVRQSGGGSKRVDMTVLSGFFRKLSPKELGRVIASATQILNKKNKKA